MKIEYVKGDLFTTNIKYIIHGCNAQGVMGSGVAKIIRDRYPEAYQEYRRIYDIEGELDLGDVIWAQSNGKWIGNAITQEFFGRETSRYVSYDAISNAMWQINEIDGMSEVAMPQIGAGLGGGDWNVIAAIIEAELTNVKPYVYVLE
jgi:O-acetyl-ADP-ribose deacetylase (regulator of RNase III)